MRILVWNIQFFTARRIGVPVGLAPDMTAYLQESTRQSMSYIVSTVQQADPDVFVVLEARATQNLQVGTLGKGGGPAGLRNLLQYLRMLDPNWCLVPPLVVNPKVLLAAGGTYTETVGVFWRNDRVNFTGPYVWPANSATGPAIAPGTGAGGPYPAPWNTAVPPGNEAAAKCKFFGKNDGSEITFTSPEERRPYLTTFKERGNTQRVVHLFSVHPRPTGDVKTATLRLGDVMQELQIPGTDEVVVFAGDFNLNVLDPTGPAKDVVEGMKGFKVGPIPFAQNGYRSIYNARADATPGEYRAKQLLDWAMVCYGPGAVPAQIPLLAVIDRVRGLNPGAPFPAFTPHMLQDLDTIQMQRASIDFAIRALDFVSFTTSTPHGLQVNDEVQVAGVADTSFNGSFIVDSLLSGHSFLVPQAKPQAHSTGGMVTSRNLVYRLFRYVSNFGHIGPPAHGIGTSDHLPIFFIV